MVGFDTQLTSVVGDKTAKALAKTLDLQTVGDLMRHYPRRYVQRGELTELSSLRDDELVTVVARVKSVSRRHMKNRRGTLLEAVVTDGTGELRLTFFNQAWRERDLRPDRIGLFAGKVGTFRDQRQLAHPEYQMFPDDVTDFQQAAEEYADEIIPVYPASEKVPSWLVAKSVEVTLQQLGDLPDPLPDEVLRKRRLPGLVAALNAVHRPKAIEKAWTAQRRLRFEEAFVLQTELARRRLSTAALPAHPRRATPGGLVDALDERLPFELTEGQRQVGDQLAAELDTPHPMHRLLQGEVGAGKTVVALRAMLAVVDAGGQAALLAPTEVLAQQHHRSLTAMLGELAQAGMLGGADQGTRVALLTGSMSTAQRRTALNEIVTGDAGIVVGTHALLEENVQFFDLGLVVVDEQHRFGVEQRAALAAKSRDGTRPHVLVMTATPIPRTVAMTVFGDLEISTLSDVPRGRADVATHVVPVDEKPHYLDRAWQRVREEVEKGHRVYIVCPRIGDDDTGSADEEPPPADDDKRRPAAVLELAEHLRTGPLQGVGLDVLHGRLPSETKDAVMAAFAAGTTPVVVATTVIEVGIDVPTASMMVIVDADRFGVSQLHQLRGRIGRGAIPGVCLLVTEAPPGTPARERLDAVAKTRDGFELSQVDLEHRREGDVLGASQSGHRSSLKLLRVIRDVEIIEQAREDAGAVVEADPDLAAHPALLDAVRAALAEQEADYLDKA
ncbi:ATP-dependent DNA helicase RecG [Jiangella sp. DSM 45060]|uniref:ATP-dependent DNA helicase RecG n=1 Tax=Jiangella sp. DSM 45060 TaxID=1798224 RepID=UPI00087B3D36|nr:ATP-dependent DNA helicase RecG [Jiangella sp. DSM 45060]SDS63606.1 ATP-dependent DNA helicase RecG [Jiangella sp. DSM 45060]